MISLYQHGIGMSSNFYVSIPNSIGARYDVWVANTGAHFRHTPELLKTIGEFANRVPSGVDLVWRTTAPGHPNCTSQSSPADFNGAGSLAAAAQNVATGSGKDKYNWVRKIV